MSYYVVPVINSDASPQAPARDGAPAVFTAAVESLHRAQLRPELSLGTIRPPQRLAPFSHAIGIEVEHPADAPAAYLDGDSFGRLILLFDPDSEDVWSGTMRLVAYIQSNMDDAIAHDPLLPDVTWQWLADALEEASANYSALGGTVTATASVRYGEIGGPPRSYQVELRASWTPGSPDLAHHVEAFGAVVSRLAGLPPAGVVPLRHP